MNDLKFSLFAMSGPKKKKKRNEIAAPYNGFSDPGEVLWFLCSLSEKGQKSVVVVCEGELNDWNHQANFISFSSPWYF